MSGEARQPLTDLVPAPKACDGVRNGAVVLLVVGAVLSAAALFGERHRVRLGFGYLWAFSFVWVVALGALFFVGLQHLVRAVWSVVVRRVAEMLASSIWLVAVLFVPILVYCVTHEGHALYPWLDAKHVAEDSVLQGKQPYLNLPFFVIRAVFFFGLWIGFAAFFLRGSLGQDAGRGNVESAVRMRKVSAPFMLIFAVTATFASFDWLMSLEPHWFSTIFGVYVFSGMVVTAL
ncbi:MAG: quinol:cytochrome C oxidoreductase, partial [Phycisphaerae bacterium]